MFAFGIGSERQPRASSRAWRAPGRASRSSCCDPTKAAAEAEQAARVHRAAGADPRRRRVRGLRRLRGRAAEAARPDGAAARWCCSASTAAPPAGRIEVTRAPAAAGRCARSSSVRPTRRARAENAALRWLWARKLGRDRSRTSARWARGQPEPRSGITDARPRLQPADARSPRSSRSTRRWSNAGGAGHERAPAAADARGRLEPRGRRAVGGAGRRRADEGDGRTGRHRRRRGRAERARKDEPLGAGRAGAGPAAPGSRAAARPTRRPTPRATTVRARSPRAKGRSRSTGRTRKQATKNEEKKSPAAGTWIVTAGKRPWRRRAPRPLVAAIRAALASGRARCLAASDVSKPIRIRVTVDAQGRIVRVELVSGDRTAEGCLRTVLAGMSSATIAQGSGSGSESPTGTVEIILRAR